MRVRAYFLIICALIVLHVPDRSAYIIIFGYAVCEQIDRWLSRRAKDKVFSQEMFLWETDPEDPGREVSGDLSRIRLEPEHQRMVTRIAQFLRRLD